MEYSKLDVFASLYSKHTNKALFLFERCKNQDTVDKSFEPMTSNPHHSLHGVSLALPSWSPGPLRSPAASAVIISPPSPRPHEAWELIGMHWAFSNEEIVSSNTCESPKYLRLWPCHRSWIKRSLKRIQKSPNVRILNKLKGVWDQSNFPAVERKVHW